MITEDYVSFETAKLLKEKGFNEYCRVVRSPSGKLFYSSNEIRNFEERKTLGGAIAAPTLQMAMKWLREMHKVNIEIHYNRFGENYKYLIIYKPEILDDIRSFDIFYSYEEACEAAIKYCLENLI